MGMLPAAQHSCLRCFAQRACYVPATRAAQHRRLATAPARAAWGSPASWSSSPHGQPGPPHTQASTTQASPRRPPLLDPDNLLAAVASAASRHRQQQQQQQQQDDLMFLDMAVAASLAGFQADMFQADQLARLAADLSTLLPPPTQKLLGGLPSDWTQALLQATEDHMHELRAADLASCAGALVTLGIDPGPAWLAQLLEQSAEQIDDMAARDLAGLLGAVAAMGYRPHDPWLELLCCRSQELGFGAFRAPELADVVCALATCGYRPADDWVQDLAHGALLYEAEFSEFSSRDAARVLWSLCAFQVLPQPDWLRACYTLILMDIERLDAECLANLLWCIGCMEVAKPTSPEPGAAGAAVSLRPPPSFMQLLLQVCTPHLRSLSSTQVVKMVWAAAALRLRPPASWLLPLVERAKQLSLAATPASTQAAKGFEPLEHMYIARCFDMVYGTIAGSRGTQGGAGRKGSDDRASTPGSDGEDEYDRLGPPPSLVQFVRDAHQALDNLATSSQMPPDWRRINLLFPPYAMSVGGEAAAAEE